MSASPVLKLHVGLPKAGSTALQIALAASATATFLGKGAARRFASPEIAQFVRQIAPYRQPTDAERPIFRAAFSAAMGDGDAVLSDEILSGVGFAARGGGRDAVAAIQAVADVAERPVQAFVVVREPMSFLRSYYAQYLGSGGDLDLTGFLTVALRKRDSWLARAIDPAGWLSRLPRASLELIAFERLVGDPAASLVFLDRLGAADAHGLLIETRAKLREPVETQRRRLQENQKKHAADHSGWQFDVERQGLTPTSGDPLIADPAILAEVEAWAREGVAALAKFWPQEDWRALGYPIA